MADIFYIPGLGGERTLARQRMHAHRLNAFLGKGIYFFEPDWYGSETAHAKIERAIAAYKAVGSPRKLFGVSAGASLAVVMAHELPDTKVVTLAGKHTGSQSIGPKYTTRSPALKPMVALSETILQDDPSIAERMTTYHPLVFDGVIPMHDIRVQGARNRTLLLPLHIPAIVLGLATVLPRE